MAPALRSHRALSLGVCRRAVTVRGHDLALRTLPLTAHGHRQILSTRTQSDLICAPRLLIAEQPPPVQIGGYLRTGRGRTPVTGRAPFSGLVYADLADSVRSGTGLASFGVVWSRAGQRPRRDNRARPALAGRRGSDGAASWCVLLE